MKRRAELPDVPGANEADEVRGENDNTRDLDVLPAQRRRVERAVDDDFTATEMEHFRQLWNESFPIILHLSLDPQKTELYKRLIGLVNAILQPEWFDRIRPMVTESIHEMGLDDVARDYLYQAIERLELENRMLNQLRRTLPATMPAAVGGLSPVFHRLLPDFERDDHTFREQKAPIQLYLDQFENAYERMLGLNLFSVNFGLWYELGLQRTTADQPLMVTSYEKLMLMIPEGDIHARITPVIEIHEAQIQAIQEIISLSCGYLLK